MKKYLCFLFLLMLCSITHAATPSTEGTEFWLTFMNNYNTQASSDELQLKLIVSSRESATITMRNPQTGWSASLSVGANQVAEYVLPNSEVYTYSAGQVEKTGVVVTSTAPVSLYAANFKEYTYDATIVMPITALGTDYVVQLYENDLYSKEFAVVATENNTKVTITPHARTTSGHVKNVAFTITLQKGESYLLMSDDTGNDFSGTRVQTNKPVAVFAGHQCINVPTGNPWCDHIVEQQLPTLMWGRQFVVTKTKGQNGDRVMLTAVNDNTKLYVNGTLKTTFNALQSYEFRLTDNSAYIETSEPATCYLYIEGARDNNMMGDPSSVHVSPIEQKIKRLTFATFQTSVSRTHYVNIVTTKSGVNSIKLDGNIISNEFNAVQGNANLMYAQIQIQNGTHTIETNIDGFVGHVYGLGDCESYAYTFGSATIPLVGQIVVNGESRTDIEYNETRCYKQELTFEPQTNVEFNTIHWDLGDGTTSTQKVVNHTYTAPGTYRIRMIITNEDGRDTAYTNLTLIEQLRDTVYADICKGDVYKFANRTYSTTGKYNVKFTSSGGCDSIVTLCLTVHDTYLVTTNATFPIGSSYRWRGKWYREEGTYYDTLTTVAGCDSILELKLTKTDPSEIMYDTICWQPTYEFKGHTFNIPSYQGFENEDYIDYVLEYRDKDACISYKMNLAIAPMVDGNEIVVYDTIQKGSVYEWMGNKYTEKGTYYKTVYQACECAIDYTLHLEVLAFPITKHYAELCHGETYTFQNKEYTESGVYYDTVWTLTGVEAIYEIKLVDARKHTEFSISNVSSYTFNGKTYTESGTYIDTLQAENGCDSIVTLHLGIREKCTISVEENIQVCEGEVIEWNGLQCEAGKSYTKTFVSTGGCDSVVTLRVEAIAKETTTLSISICQGDYYQIGGQKLYTEGEHSVVFTSTKGCDSVVVVQLSYNEVYDKIDNVTVKEGESYTWQGEIYSQAGVYKKACIASNGCDSVMTLELNVLSIIVAPEENATICYGETYKWNGKEYSESGVYKDTLQSAQGCDSIVTLNLTVLPKVVGTEESAIICYGETYAWRGVDYSVSGVYKDTLQTDKGCDSIVAFNLTVLPEVVGKEESATVCYGESYKWQGVDYLVSGIYKDTLQSTQGCDSVVTLNLTVLPEVVGKEESATVCYGESYRWHGVDYSVSGVYSDTLQSTQGCDSIVTLNLTVLPKVVGTEESVTICYGESYKWQDVEYFEGGVYKDTLQSAQGCDSIVTLILKVLPEVVGKEENATICYGESYRWQGVDYFASGVYKDTLQSAQGCDSIVTLNLTVLPKVVGTEENATICYGESYRWQGVEYFEAGVYKDTLQSAQGCDSIVAFNLTVLPKVVGTEENATICYGETYTWRGVDYFASGVYKDTLQSAQGCDSIVTLNLTVLPEVVGTEESATICYGETYTWRGVDYSVSGVYKDTLQTDKGCDSIVAFNLTVLPKVVGTEENATICYGESYKWQGVDYFASGLYNDTLQSAQGCDSIVTLNLTVLPKVVGTEENATICYGESYRWHGVEYSEAGVYRDTLQTDKGCDSVITLNLTILPEVVGTEESAIICYGESYRWQGVDYSVSGVYSDTLQSTQGCDSIVTLNLTILPKVVGTEESATICYGESYTWRGVEYSTSGVYKDTLQTDKGCDSIVMLNLTVLPEVVGIEESAIICYGETYKWNSKECSKSGVYVDTLQSAQGCDSVIILNLTVLPEVVGTEENATICYGESYRWQGVEYFEAGVYKDTLQSAQGCDSIVTLNLTVLPEVVGTEESATICYGESYRWRGVEYFEAGVYKDTLQSAQGCDSIVTLNLTVLPEVVGTEENATICYGESYRWHSVEYFEAGVYKDTLQSAQGCDSIVTLNLTVLPSYIFADTITIQEGDSYSWRGDTYEEAGVYSDSLLTIDGCDSVYILTLIVEETIVEDVVVDEINIVEQCAGTGVMDVEVTLTSGVVDEVSFEFSQDAIDVGLENTTLPYSNQMQVQYTDVRAGKYKLKLIGLCNGTKVFEEEKDLTFLYPSTVLMQKWNDVVAVLTHDYNGGYNFVDFKWYKNGVVLSGETRSYIHQTLEIGAEYSALLTEDNGMQLMTCPLIAINNVDISLYPTLLNSGQRVKCNVSEFAVIYIYDMMGNLVSECNVQSGETEIEMPYAAGVYMAKIVTETNKESNIKLIVR